MFFVWVFFSALHVDTAAQLDIIEADPPVPDLLKGTLSLFSLVFDACLFKVESQVQNCVEIGQRCGRSFCSIAESVAWMVDVVTSVSFLPPHSSFFLIHFYFETNSASSFATKF
jgi:hypothetical protein